MVAFAHSANSKGQRHDLVAHLRAVAQLATEFGAAFGAGQIAHLAGLWHDLGKFHPDFQAYLQRCEVDPAAKGSGPDHKAAGCVQAGMEFMAQVLAGHHGGLRDLAAHHAWLGEREQDPRTSQALEIARGWLPDLEGLREPAAAQFQNLRAAWKGQGVFRADAFLLPG